MATGSAFGITAYDPIMSSVEGWVNSYFDKKAEKRAYERQLALMAEQYAYAQRYAENTPTWTVTGLRNAGLNPILAVSNGVHTSAQAPMVPSASSHRSPITSKASFSASGLLPFDRRITKQNADAQSLMARAADKQGDAALIKASNDSSKLASDIAKTIAESDLLKQDFQRNEGNGGWRQNWMADIHRLLLPFYDSVLKGGDKAIDFIKDRWNRDNDSKSYLQHAPLRPMEPVKTAPMKKDDDSKEYEYNGRKYRFRTIPKD